jgi:hypothetical protein
MPNTQHHFRQRLSKWWVRVACLDWQTGTKCPSQGQSLWKSCAVATSFPMVSITCLPGKQQDRDQMPCTGAALMEVLRCGNILPNGVHHMPTRWTAGQGSNALHRSSSYGSPALWQHSSQRCPSYAYQVNSRTGIKCPTQVQSLWKSCAVATSSPMVSITCLPGKQQDRDQMPCRGEVLMEILFVNHYSSEVLLTNDNSW